MVIRPRQIYFLLFFALCVGAWSFVQYYYLPTEELAEMQTIDIVLAGVNIQARLAVTPGEQARGLAGVAVLENNEGMLFQFSPPTPVRFWNKGMIMPFDLIWIRNGRVVGWEANVPVATEGEMPLIHESGEAIDYVLELPAGWVDRYGVRIGDQTIGLLK